MGCAAWHSLAFTVRLHQLQKLEQVYSFSNLDGTAKSRFRIQSTVRVHNHPIAGRWRSKECALSEAGCGHARPPEGEVQAMQNDKFAAFISPQDEGSKRRALEYTVDGHALLPEEGVQAGPAQGPFILSHQQAGGIRQPLHGKAPALRQAHLQRRPEAVPAHRRQIGLMLKSL